ncbi:MAG: hypothetical protein F2589_02180 [Actinobacteria bacterium]|nr:hypothetical protein [Actinomycetota bacterium]MSZ54075.1 hypothetical protein [Actinomycetota bacterium]MTA79546.1 hypothetical protein [Actinomycetota bacterium]
MNSLTWWLWSISLSIATLRTNNNWLMLLAILIFVIVVFKRRNLQAPLNAFALSIQLAVVALIIRLFFGTIIGTPLPGTVLISLPQLPMPDWLVGIRIGGDITSERIGSVLTESLKFSLILISFGAATCLSSPIEIIKAISSRLYFFAITLLIATSVLPQIVFSYKRVIAARRMRGMHKLNIFNFRTIITPVLEESLERAIDLSSAMESRGFGYHKKPTRYRPEKFSQSDLIVTIICGYLIIFIPTLLVSNGWLFTCCLFIVFSAAPLMLTEQRVANT